MTRLECDSRITHHATAAQVRALEAEMFASGMPEAALMEKAGLALARAIDEGWPKETHHAVAVLAGPGHNGADALVVARELLLSGRKVQVWSPFENRKELTARHLAWFCSLGGEVITDLSNFHPTSLLVDGLLGFGAMSAPTGRLAEGISFLNQASSPIVSIDVPSGLNSDSGQPVGGPANEFAVRATETLCLGVLKSGLVQDSALGFCGQLKFVDIGFPKSLVARHCSTQGILTRNTFAKHLPRPIPDSHKFTNGRALLIAGSGRYPGAAILAAEGCRAAGTGYVVVDAPSECAAPLLATLPEMVLSHNAIRMGSQIFDAALCGPGLDGQIAKLEAALSCSFPLVLDADALTMLAQRKSFLPASTPRVLTPHEGEFARLFPHISKEHPRWERARQAACESQSIVVLKGGRSVVASPEGETWTLPHSTPALARAGTGDVLAGFLCGLLARGVAPHMAALAAVHTHACAALRLESTHGASGLTPQLLARELAIQLPDFS